MTALVAAVCLLLPATASATRGYDGHVSGTTTGPSHSFMIGDGLRLVFRDYRHAAVNYRVCWNRNRGQTCWRATTRKRGKASTLLVAAPSKPGTYTTTWYVGSRAVTTWTFDNAHCN